MKSSDVVDLGIYGRCQDTVARAALWPRLVSALISMACLGALLTAAWLAPSRAGFGTHLGLGLTECAFLQRTGVPCPGCGMTTSFAWFARGNLIASLYVQPMGTLLAAACCAAVWAGFYIAVTGRPVYRFLTQVLTGPVLIPVLGFGLAAWGWKIFIHLKRIDGW